MTASDIEQISVTELPDDFPVDGDWVLLDVREPYEWDEVRIPGALHIPLEQVPARIDEIDLDRELAVICRNSGRSFRILAYLTQRGIPGYCVTGGMTAWQAAGKPVARGETHD